MLETLVVFLEEEEKLSLFHLITNQMMILNSVVLKRQVALLQKVELTVI